MLSRSGGNLGGWGPTLGGGLSSVVQQQRGEQGQEFGEGVFGGLKPAPPHPIRAVRGVLLVLTGTGPTPYWDGENFGGGGDKKTPTPPTAPTPSPPKCHQGGDNQDTQSPNNWGAQTSPRGHLGTPVGGSWRPGGARGGSGDPVGGGVFGLSAGHAPVPGLLAGLVVPPG